MLRLLAAGRTNPQIGAELYISASTASVHVSNILRKLGVSSRVQAAALAERAGLLPPGRPEHRPRTNPGDIRPAASCTMAATTSGCGRRSTGGQVDCARLQVAG